MVEGAGEMNQPQPIGILKNKMQHDFVAYNSSHEATWRLQKRCWSKEDQRRG